MHTDFYVYILFHWNGLPYYVGKGRMNRLARHPDIPKVKVREELTNAEALKIERSLIFALGLRPLGLLINKNYGGSGSAACTAEHREMMRSQMLGKQHALGYRHTAETKRRIGRASKEMWAAGIGVLPSNPRVAKPKPPRAIYGSDEWKAKIGRSNTGKTRSEATIARFRLVAGNNTRNKVWITNSSAERRIAASERIPDGWQRGRKTKPSSEKMRAIIKARWAKEKADSLS